MQPESLKESWRKKGTTFSQRDLFGTVAEVPCQQSARRIRATFGKAHIEKSNVEALQATYTRGGLPRLEQLPQEGFAEYSVHGDGKLDGDKDEGVRQFGWESDVKTWVMGGLGNELLTRLENRGLATSADQMFPQKDDAMKEYRPRFDRRRGHCQSPGWLNCGGRCACEYYNQQLFLPLTCFTALEMAMDLQAAARQLLDQSGLRVKKADGSIARSDDFIIVVERLDPPERQHSGPSSTFTSFGQASHELEQRLTDAQRDHRGHVPWGDFEKVMRESRQSSGKDSPGRKTNFWGQTMSSSPRHDTATSGCGNIFATMAMKGGHFVCYRLKTGHKRLRASIAEQDESGVIPPEASSQLPVSMPEYEANEMLLPHLLKFCEEYRAVKVGQLVEEKRAVDDLKAKEPFRFHGQGAGARGTDLNARSSYASTTSWKPFSTGTGASPARSVMSQTAPGSFHFSSEKEPSYEDAIERPRVLCRCGHGELWHQQPKKRSAKPLAIKDRNTKVRQLPVATACTTSSYVLPVDDGCRCGTASIRNGRLAFSKLGTKTLSSLQQSASAPGLVQ